MLFLAGVSLIYAGYGTLDMAALADMIEAGPVAWTALALMTAGLLLKTALFPLHFWLPPAHASAPAPVSAVLSALVVKVAFYLVLRLWLDVFATVVTPAAANLLGMLGAGAVLWGSWQALHAERLKLLAAYSTVAQLGYLFLFFPLLLALPPGPARELAAGGLVMLALTHGFAKAGLFLAIGVIQQHSGHDRIRDLSGTAQRLPATTFAIALAGVALIGLPPSGAFLGKWQLLAGAFATGQWLWVVVTAASVRCWLRPTSSGCSATPSATRPYPHQPCHGGARRMAGADADHHGGHGAGSRRRAGMATAGGRVMNLDTWLPLLVVASSLLPGLVIFFLREGSHRLRTVLNLAGAIAQAGAGRHADLGCVS